MKAIVFYDADCGFCDWAVRLLSRLDTNRTFVFAPSTGKTAERELASWRAAHPDVESIVLKEGSAYFWRSRAVFRILYLLGFPWSILGLFCFLPGPILWPFDVVYRGVARVRRTVCPVAQDKKKEGDDRFLP